MDESAHPPPIDDVVDQLRAQATGDASTSLQQYEAASSETRKRLIQRLRTLADDDPDTLTAVVSGLTPFLTDDVRAIRLTTAKLLVSVAKADPEAVVPLISALADRLADDDEFYYVRARSAEALGYVALERPDDVSSPEVVADLCLGLSFDEPEVKEKLAKALEYISVGDPTRLRHRVSTLADHLDDEDELVRYHLSTAVVAVGCASPERLTSAREALVERLHDENDVVRGRAFETIGLLARVDPDVVAFDERSTERLEPPDESDTSFVAERVRFALDALGVSDTPDTPNTSDAPFVSLEATGEVGTIDSVRETTSEAVEAIRSPGDGQQCPHCKLELPEQGPPLCPRCGGPY